MLEAVVNLSEGRDEAVLSVLAAAARAAGRNALLDVHSDASHHRTVFSLGGPRVALAVRLLATAALERLDISSHTGVHPRLGVVDVVPFVRLPHAVPTDPPAPPTAPPSVRLPPPVPPPPEPGPPVGDLGEAVIARDEFAEWLADRGVPCFLYGPESAAAPERTLPEIRRRAWRGLAPDVGPHRPHPTAGACCVGARPILVAYNLWLAADPPTARQIAAALRGPCVRSLGLDLDGTGQVSCNLIEPLQVGPEAVYDFVAARAPIRRAELVGLIPRAVLARTPPGRWEELDLGESKTIEGRLGL